MTGNVRPIYKETDKLARYCRDVYFLKIKVRFGLEMNPTLPTRLQLRLKEECNFVSDTYDWALRDYRELLQATIEDSSVPVRWRKVCEKALHASIG